MKILHFADLHIGVENYGRVNPSTGLSTRLEDFLQTYDELVDYAIENEVDMVLFAGDAYKSRDPSQTHQREFARRISRLSKADIPTFLLVGNHDSPQVMSQATALEIFPTLDVSNVYLGDRLETYLVKTNDGPLQIVALPWIKRSEFLAQEATRGLTHQEINQMIESNLVDAIQFHAEKLDPALPAIFTGHVTIAQSTLASEQSMMLGHDHVLFTNSVALPQFEYVALGHIHRHQVLSHDPVAAYAGSLQRVDFGEEKDPKGFCVVDINPNFPQGRRLESFEFVESDARKFLTIDVSLDNQDDDPTASVVNQIESCDIEGAIVRVRISMAANVEPLLVENQIRAALNPAQYVAAISRERLEGTHTRVQQADAAGLSPTEALDLYCASRGIPDDRTKLLKEYATNLIGRVALHNKSVLHNK